MLSEITKKRIELQFEKFAKEFPELAEQVREEKKEETRFLLQYLYANMPQGDVADCPIETCLSFARHGSLLMQEDLWEMLTSDCGNQEENEEIFLDYVVYHRVNTEGISPCRELFYKELKDRVAGRTLREAILEVNYWCAEEVTYRCSDERTLSAAAVYYSGTGRCGEESVFTVNALRSVGIPARQVYAHRWSHCDDNHAWVEVWCDNDWHYLGACEPEEELDKGWFTGAASRAMMVNSRVFGFQSPKGQAVMKDGMSTAVSELERYAKTADVTVKAVDADGKPVTEAEVSCEVLNYAELVPVISGKTDEQGCFFIRSGRGSLMIHMRKGCIEGSKVIIAGQEKEAVITMANEDPFYKGEEWCDFDMYAPAESPDLYAGKVTNDICGAEKKRRAREKYLQKMHTTAGNAEEIRRFLEDMPGDLKWKKIMIDDLVEKDRRDCTADILYDHFIEAIKWKDTIPDEIFRRYVLAPRIGIEQPSKYRGYIRQIFSEEEVQAFRENPEQIRSWISEHIWTAEEKEYPELITVPAGMLRIRSGSRMSKEILFVAICRTFGIPAGLDPAEGMGIVYAGHAESAVPISFYGSEEIPWTYGENWTVSRKTTDGWKTLRLRNSFGENRTAELRPGQYRVITSNRLPSGDQFAAVRLFTVKENVPFSIVLRMREAGVEDLLLKTSLPDFTLYDRNGRSRTVEKMLERHGEMIYIWLEENAEPTEHILNEICEKAGEYSALGSKLCFVCGESGKQESPTFEKVISALPEAVVLYDPERKVQEQLARRMYKDPDALPFLLVVDRSLTGVYAESGYNVGTGEMLLRVFRAAAGETKNKN